MNNNATYLRDADFINDWDQWKNTVEITLKAARKIGMPDKLIEIPSVKAGNFLSNMSYLESKEDALIKDLWEVATPQERKTLGKLLFEVIDKYPNIQGRSEPYAGY
jgi:hypothetical protein